MKIWIDGTLVDSRKAKVPVMSHALHYGSGVFEGVRVYETDRGPGIFRLRDHIDRLFRSAAAFDMSIPYSKEKIMGAVKKTIVANKLRSCYVRPLVFFGEGRLTLATEGVALHTVVAAWPWGAYLGDEPAVSVGISRYARFDPRSVVPGAKITGFYATSVLARREAHMRGFDECVLLDHEGFVGEGPGENIFIVKKGKLFTPKSESILPGITRASVIALARDLRIPVIEKKLSKNELFSADEAFFAGTAVEIGVIGKVNRRLLRERAPGPVTRKIKDAYYTATRGNDPKHRAWITIAK